MKAEATNTIGSGHGSIDRLKRSVVDHYERALHTHGSTARGMDWKDEASQQTRFAVLSEVCDLTGKEIHDVGAGAGHLYDFLKTRRIDVQYSGSDLSAEIVEAARRRHPGVRFEYRDLLADPPMPVVDLLFCSGLFHVKLNYDESAWSGFVEQMVGRMFALCRVGIAFNLISHQVDYRADNLYYSDPRRMFDFCRARLSRYVTLRHDYPLHEYTVYVYREPII